MRVVAVGLVRGAVADDGPDLDQSWLVGAAPGLCDGLAEGGHVGVAVLDRQHLPAVGLVTLAHVLGEGELGAEAEVARVRAGLVGDALLAAAVAHDAIGVVVDQGQAWLVVDGRVVRLGSCEAHSVETPMPSGPVVTSMPAVSKFSGWPGVSEPHCLNCFRSSMETLS